MILRFYPMRCERVCRRLFCSGVLLGWALAGVLGFSGRAQGAELDQVTLRLKWRPQFQFAGYYAAQSQGYYAAEGLSVQIDPGGAARSAVEAVLSGDADFGVGDSDLVRSRLNGNPVVVCAAVFQHSPYVVMTRADRNIRLPSDLIGKTVMLSDDEGRAQMMGMLLKEGIDPAAVRQVSHNRQLTDLIQGKVDGISAYATVEPAQMRKLGIEPYLLKSSDYGVDFYGDVLFTTESEAMGNPGRTEAFVRASMKGWAYALKHPEQLADLIMELPGVRERGTTKEILLAEAAAMRPYILPDVVEIGHINPGRWQQITDVFIRLGMVPEESSLDGFVFSPEAAPDGGLPVWLFRLLVGAAVVWVGVLLWNVAIRRKVIERTRQLAGEIALRTQVEESLRASEQRFRMMFDGAATGIAVISPSGHFWQANPSYCATTGYSEAELKEMTIAEVLDPQERPRASRLFTELINGGQDHFITEVRCVSKAGKLIWKRASVSLIRSKEQQPVSIIIVAEDVTARYTAERELVRGDRAKRMLSGCNEALVRAESENDLLADICRVAVDIGGYRMAWVGFADLDADKTIRPVVHFGNEENYLSKISLSWDEAVPAGRGPAGLTIRSGQAVVCADIESDDRFAHWRETAMGHGYRSVVCLPLRDEQRTYGLLGLYANESVEIGSDEIGLLQQLTDDLAFGIGVIRVREDRQKTLNAVLTVSEGVSAAIGDAFFDRLTQSMVTVLGADVGLVARLSDENSQIVQTLALVVDHQRQENFSYDMAGLPCANISPEGSTVLTKDVQKDFPACGLLARFDAQAYIGHPLLIADGKMIGFMAVLFRQPVERADFVVSTLRIFASRAAAELDRQQIDSQVREQAALLDKAQDAFIVHDLEHHITYWNKSSERLYGWSKDQVAGRLISDLLYRDPTDYHEATQQTIAKGEWQGELRQRTKAGADIIVECHWTLVRDNAGNPCSVLAINTDITEKKRIEHQFLRAQRMESIGTLAGGIAHDLNNVLSPVMMAADLLKFDETDPRKITLLESIHASAHRGADMVRQVLSFARGMGGNRVEERIELILRAVSKIASDTFPKDIVIKTTIADGLWPVVGDATQIHQVLINLCVNARDAMPEGGALTLLAKNVRIDENETSLYPEAKQGDFVCVEVSDTGVGVAPNHLEKIFDPFFTTKEIGQGTGLGLSTTLAIVRGHGGFVRVYSEIGNGTHFMVYFPVGHAARAALQSAPALDLPRGHGETVLVVDDEAPIREIARKILEAFGYRVILAADGADAISLYSKNRKDIALVITDMMMPVMDGTATICALKKLNPSVRIIAASGITLNGKIAKAETAGVTHFLPKPFTAPTLLLAVQAALN